MNKIKDLVDNSISILCSKVRANLCLYKIVYIHVY